MTIFGKTNRLARKTNLFFIALLRFTSSEDAAVQSGAPSKSETRFFSLFPLASSCSNAYIRAYAIIDFLADRLVFLNTVT